MQLLKRLAIVCVTAYILMFFSEYFFINEELAFSSAETVQTNPLPLAFDIFELTLWYALPAYIFLIAIERFSVNTIWPLILAGSLYGFFVEGVMVWQMYEGLPYTISWTPLGWHVIVDVLIGWYLVRHILRQNVYWKTAVFAIIAGLFWGIWGTWYWIEQVAIQPIPFAFFTGITGSLWVIANMLQNKLIHISFKPTKIEIWVLIFLSGVMFSLQILPILPMAVLILPPLLALTFFALNRNRQTDSPQNILTTLQGKAAWQNTALLLLTPAIAMATYPIYYHFELQLFIIELVPFMLMAAGFIVYGVAWWETAVRRIRAQ